MMEPGTYVLATYAPSRWVALQLSPDVHDLSSLGTGAPHAGSKGYERKRIARDALLDDLRKYVANPHRPIRRLNGDSLFAWLFVASTRREAMDRLVDLLDVPFAPDRRPCVAVLALTREERASFRLAMMEGGEVCRSCGQRVKR